MQDNKDRRRVINIPSDTTLSYLSLFNFIFKLTDRELEVLVEFVDWERKIREDNLNIKVFGTDVRASVAEKLDIGNINTYVKKLKDKQAIKVNDKELIINPILVLRESNEVTFRFSPKGGPKKANN